MCKNCGSLIVFDDRNENCECVFCHCIFPGEEAIKILEDAGLNVSFTGSGMVTGQSLAAGSHYARGQRINLRLRNY